MTFSGVTVEISVNEIGKFSGHSPERCAYTNWKKNGSAFFQFLPAMLKSGFVARNENSQNFPPKFTDTIFMWAD